MTIEERCILAINRGYTYDPETGIIYNRFGKEVTCLNTFGYIQIGLTINKKTYNLKGHQFGFYIVYNKTVDCIDHINQIKNDNRICNLRSVTRQENNFNSNVNGYRFIKSTNKYQALIKLNYKSINLGIYNTKEEAQQAYLTAKEKYHKIEKRN